MENKPVDSVVGPGAVGPGAVEGGGERPKPTLEGANEYEYVVLLNPLPYDFVGQVAVTRTVNAPMRVGKAREDGGLTNNQDDVARNYGLDLRNPDIVGRQHITNRIPIPAGKTRRMFGNEAQIILRQLVDVVMSHEGRMIAKGDPFARNEVEMRLVISRGSMTDFMDSRPASVEEQMRVALEKENEREFESVTITEQFSESVTGTGEEDQGSGVTTPETDPTSDSTGEPIKRGPGRPPGSRNKA